MPLYGHLPDYQYPALPTYEPSLPPQTPVQQSGLFQGSPPLLPRAFPLPPRSPSPEPSYEPISYSVANLLFDTSLSDVILISNTSSRHPAVRSILALRSPEFKRFFFQEQLKELQVPFSPLTIDDMLRYVYQSTVARCNNIDRYLNLLRMSRKYDIFGLLAIVPKLLRDCLRKQPHRICDVFQQCDSMMNMYHWCVDQISQAPTRCLKYSTSYSVSRKELEKVIQPDPPVLVLDHRHLRHLLENQNLRISETKMFELLFLWATNGVDLVRLRNSHIPDGISEEQWRAIKESETWLQAREMAHLIDYERIKPSYLTSHVRCSGLVSEDALSRTFENQALEAERGRALFDNLRGGSKFNNGETIVSVTEGVSNVYLEPYVTAGRHEWTLKIRAQPDSKLFIGFSNAIPSEVDEQLFCEQGRSWAWSNDGWTYPPAEVLTQSGYRKFAMKIREEGLRQIRVILNLCRTGTFSIEVAGEVVCLWNDMKAVQGRKYWPCLALGRDAVVELICEKHLE